MKSSLILSVDEQVAEALGASKSFVILDHFYKVVASVISSKRGIVESFNGSSFRGAFGIPFSQEVESVAHDAVSSALLIRDKMSEWINEADRSTYANIQKLEVRIGVTSGMVQGGKAGPDERLEYVIIGDSCYQAQQLSSSAQTFGVSVVIDRTTRESLGEDFHLRELDAYPIGLPSVGETKITTLFQVVDIRSVGLSRDTVTSFICFELGLSEYRQQNWIMCVSHFRKAVQLTNDGPSKVMTARAKAILDGRFEVPKEDWDETWNPADEVTVIF